MRYSFLFIAALLLLSCSNFWGNPYKKSLSPSIVPVRDTLLVEPPKAWTGAQSYRLDIHFERPDLAQYAVRLEKVPGIELLKVEKGSSPNILIVTLEIKKRAPEQNAVFHFSNGQNTFTHEYPIRAAAVKKGNER